MVHDLHVFWICLNGQDNLYPTDINNNVHYFENVLHYSRIEHMTEDIGQSCHSDYSQQQQGDEEGEKFPPFIFGENFTVPIPLPAGKAAGL